VQPAYDLTPRRGGSKIAIIVMVVVVVVVVLPAVGIWLFTRFLTHKAEEFVGAGPCTLVSDATASKGLGRPISLNSGTGLGGVVSRLIDDRVLSKAPSCYGSFTSPDGATGGGLVRVAVYTGSDAGARFRNEVTQAKGVTVASSSSAGGSSSVDTLPYYGKPMPGVGDEAFCTDLGISGSVGVLARKGDRLVYGSVTVKFGAATDLPTPTSTASPVELPDLAASCRQAATFTKAVLDG
jgi:hypothetical protein